MTFRCSTASLEDDEPMVGTAPAEPAWLLVEYAGPWGREARAESRLPEEVRELDTRGVRVELIRRHHGRGHTGTTVFAAWLGAGGAWVERTVLADPREVVDLDLGALADGRSPGLPAYDDQLWLVCTNGRRDRCCAELGRPIATVLSERWPEQTWEATHLGGHRFAGTMIGLPSGWTLGRLDPDAAIEACEQMARGARPDVDHLRGRAGRDGVDQVRELAGPGASVTRRPGPPRRQSCADDKLKGTWLYDVTYS